MIPPVLHNLHLSPCPTPSLPNSLNDVFCLAQEFEFSASGQDHHGISKLEKMSPVWPPHKTGQKESSFTPQVSSSWLSPCIWTLSVRSIHNLVRQLAIVVAIVMTTNDIYDMIQNLQNALSCLITITNLRITVIHILQVSTLRNWGTCPRTWNLNSDFLTSNSMPF